jgi:hypothetical protein
MKLTSKEVWDLYFGGMTPFEIEEYYFGEDSDQDEESQDALVEIKSDFELFPDTWHYCD